MWINQAWNATRWTTYGSKVQVFDGSPYLVDTSLQELSMGKKRHPYHPRQIISVNTHQPTGGNFWGVWTKNGFIANMIQHVCWLSGTLW